MKVSFRVTLLTALLALVIATVAAVGVNAYIHAQATADELAAQILSETAARIDFRFDKLISQAQKLHRATAERIDEDRVPATEFARHIGYFRDGLELATDITGYFIGLEATGEAAGITRAAGEPTVWQSTRNAADGSYEAREYSLDGYPDRPLQHDTGSSAPDIRTRPWYRAAKDAHKPVWTPAIDFLGARSAHDVVGVTFAWPVYAKDGSLVAVLDADFDSQDLCQFLRTLNLGKSGVGFVIDSRDDGTEQVIAYPDTSKLLGARSGQDDAVRGLIAPSNFPDPRVAAFARKRTASGLRPDPRHWERLDFDADGERYFGVFRQLNADSSPPWVNCIVLSQTDVLGYVYRGIRLTFLISIGILALAIGVSLLVAGQVARPLELLAGVAGDVGRLRFERQPVAHSAITEVDRLAVAMEDMKTGLRSFQKFVPADLVSSLLATGREAGLTGERRRVTILFTDIADFTSIAEAMTPEDVVEQLREYFGVLSGEITAAGGTVDKYIGDSVMAFWGAPTAEPRHAARACEAAIRCHEAVTKLTQAQTLAGKKALRTRIGLHTGEVVAGNIGSEVRLNYTVIGDAVNLASRLEGMNKLYGTSMIISETTYTEANASVVARPIDYVSVKGKQTATLIYELLGLRDGSHGDLESLASEFETVMRRYRGRDWSGAAKKLEGILSQRPDDRPAHILLDRCQEYLAEPPDADWDGVFRVHTK